MSAPPLDATGLPRESEGARGPRPASRPAPARRGARIALPAALALLAVPLITAAHHSRPAPYGDRLTVHGRVAGSGSAAATGLRTRDGAVEAYDRGSGTVRWTYTRKGRTPVTLLAAPEHAFALWSDGLVTDTARDGGSVRWHRAIPASAAWLRTPGARSGAGVLRPLAPGARMLAVVTPHRIAAYRAADGDLRWVLPARPGCAFEPARSLRRGGALLVAQPCTGPAASWTSQVIAVDDYGRIVPGRTPLGNGDPQRDGERDGVRDSGRGGGVGRPEN
ncbi:PQQ-binding-like beta-propeller repeat protein [Streptomyces sp. NRRL S-1521]|uniref:outer membrane protein assembly factor BamB family protein n=1 Tax=Streptomyces sp. NRRL S-1521 TaxID=1609100 RepID=UPI0007C764F1|nr:PQQ-binding-like beta-propeller repeat protein [Streptomyces sp. NRRL S-1521]